MPANAPRRAGRGGLGLAGFQSLDQRERRQLRVGDDGKAADVGNIHRGDVHRSAKLLGPLDRTVHVVDADIADPARRGAGSLRLLRQAHQRGDGGVCDGE